MTALSGFWALGDRFDPVSSVQSMMTAQQPYGPHGSAWARSANVAVGRSLYQNLPEDRFDTQPLKDLEADRLLVADLRIDNRDEMFSWIGRPVDERTSDAELLFQLYRAYGKRVFDRLIGDFAAAIWDGSESSLTLVRDPLGQRPLHYHRGRGFLAFASMPSGLHALEEVPREVDVEQLAAFIADIPKPAQASYFSGIKRVVPGELLTLKADAQQSHFYWQMPSKELRFPDESDYAEALRERLDRATRARLRGVGNKVGAHLSAGLDSSAVTATAARLMARDGGQVVAFTSAPRIGFDGPSPPHRINDESGFAALTASTYPNIEHVVLRGTWPSPLDLLCRDSALFQEPIGHPCNNVWWSSALGEARERGLSVMLTGEAGNLTISAGGLSTLADFIRTGRLGKWFQEVSALAGTGPSWKGILATSFGPWLPRRLWSLMMRAAGEGAAGEGAALLHPRLAAALQQIDRNRTRGGRPERDGRRVRFEGLQQTDAAGFKKGILARWGIDERDPTADRRVAEFCLSLPPDQLLKGGKTRRLARLGFSDRLPAEVVAAPRGYQFADWFEAVDPSRCRELIERLSAEEAGTEILDIGRVRSLLEAWPKSGWESPVIISRYRIGLLMGLSAAVFASTLRRDLVRSPAINSKVATSGVGR